MGKIIFSLNESLPAPLAEKLVFEYSMAIDLCIFSTQGGLLWTPDTFAVLLHLP